MADGAIGQNFSPGWEFMHPGTKVVEGDIRSSFGMTGCVFIRVADIEDIYLLPKTFADVVLANGVINLCPDKFTVFKNIFRILRPGGILILSDIVLADGIDPQVDERIRLDRTSCLSGAVSTEEHLRNLERLTFEILQTEYAGLTVDDIETIGRYPDKDSLPLSQEDLLHLQGKAVVMTVLAKRRPFG